MKQSEMISRINARVDDQVEVISAIEWLNDGKDLLAIAVESVIPNITESSDSTFDFPERFHLAPVLYACARFKEADGSLQESNNFFAQFDDLKKEFVQTYQVPPKYRDDRLAQNFVAIADQTEFIITKIGFHPSYNRLKVFVNDIPTDKFTQNENLFTLSEPCLEADKVTAVWEEHADIIEPPYAWWRSW